MKRADARQSAEKHSQLIDPAAIAFDIDGVVADTMTLFLTIAQNEYQLDGLRYEDITSYNLETCLHIEPELVSEISDKIVAGNFSEPLKANSGAAPVLGRLSRRHSPILFVTARPYDGPIRQWLIETLSLGADSFEVIPTGSFDNKADVLLERNIAYFVEDRLETCFYLDKAGIKPVVYQQPWNRQPHGFMEVASWAELAIWIDFDRYTH